MKFKIVFCMVAILLMTSNGYGFHVVGKERKTDQLVEGDLEFYKKSKDEKTKTVFGTLYSNGQMIRVVGSQLSETSFRVVRDEIYEVSYDISTDGN